MSDNNADLGAFLAGFVIGGLVGAATALILAPQSGQETRSQIASKSRELQRTGEEQVRHYRELADSYRDKVGDTVSDARDRLEETGGQVQEQARIVLDAGKERVSQAREQVETTVQQEGKESQPTEGDTPPTS